MVTKQTENDEIQYTNQPQYDKHGLAIVVYLIALLVLNRCDQCHQIIDFFQIKAIVAVCQVRSLLKTNALGYE
jgi:hypothetical protein